MGDHRGDDRIVVPIEYISSGKVMERNQRESSDVLDEKWIRM
jgi:hypothetical protein